jgi:hypothetical protein
VIEQLLPATGHGMRIHIEERGRDRIAAQAEFDRFKPANRRRCCSSSKL